MGSVVAISEAPSRRGRGPLPADPVKVAGRVLAGERLLSAQELSSRLGRSLRSIRRDRQDGMPCIPCGLNSYVYILADVLAWHQMRRETTVVAEPWSA